VLARVPANSHASRRELIKARTNTRTEVIATNPLIF
jgi:hypothetical protein